MKYVRVNEMYREFIFDIHNQVRTFQNLTAQTQHKSISLYNTQT